MADLNVIYKIAADISGLQSGVNRAAKAAEGLESTAATVGKALTAAFTVAAVAKLGNDIIDFAGNLADLSAQTGISTTGLQKFDLAFSAAGVSMESVANASLKLANNLIGGDKSTVSALQKLGLSVADLKTLKPEDQFIKVGDAIGKIQNPTERAYAAMQVFGKGGAELLKGLDGHLAETVDQFEELGLVVDEQTIQQIDDFGDTVGLLGKQFIALAADAIGPLLPVVGQLIQALMPLAKILGETLGVAIKLVWTAFLGLGEAIDTVLASMLEGLQKIPFSKKIFGDLSGTIAYLRADAQKAGDAMAALWTSTDDATESAKKAQPAILGLGGAAEKADASVKRLADRIQELNRANAAGIVPRPEYTPAAGELPELSRIRAIVAAAEALKGLSPIRLAVTLDAPSIEQSIANTGAFGIEKVGQALDRFTLKVRTLGDSIHSLLSGDLKAVFSDVGAFFTKGLGDIGRGVLEGFGHLITGGITSLISVGLSAAWKGIKSLFGNNAEKQVNPIRQAFVDAAGGLEALNQQAARAGVTLTAMLNAKTPEAYKKAIDDLNAALQFQDDAMATLDATVQKYGFTIEQLGPAFGRQQLDKRAQELYQDFRVLQAAGVPVASILEQMGTSINQFAQDAIRTGTEVPAAMKPLLQQMIDHGELLDENGNAYTSLEETGLSFSETMTQGFNKLIATVDKLTEAIARGLGIALDNLPDEKTVDVNVNTHYTSDASDTQGPEYVPEYAASGGVVTSRGISWTPSGTDIVPAMLSPGEVVLSNASAGQLAAALSASGSGGAVSGGGVNVGTVSVQMYVTENVDRQALSDNFKELLRTDASVYDAIGVVATRSVVGVA